MQNINFVKGLVGTLPELGKAKSPEDENYVIAAPNEAKIVFSQGWYLSIYDHSNILEFIEKNPDHLISQYPQSIFRGRSKNWVAKNPYRVHITACHYDVSQELSKSWNISQRGLKKYQQFLPYSKNSSDLRNAHLNPELLKNIITWLAAQPRHPKNDEGMKITRAQIPFNHYLPENWNSPEFQTYQF